MANPASKTLNRIAELHRFFCRESQLFVMGHWYRDASARQKRKFVAGFPRAYLRFMWFSLLPLPR